MDWASGLLGGIAGGSKAVAQISDEKRKRLADFLREQARADLNAENIKLNSSLASKRDQEDFTRQKQWDEIQFEQSEAAADSRYKRESDEDAIKYKRRQAEEDKRYQRHLSEEEKLYQRRLGEKSALSIKELSDLEARNLKGLAANLSATGAHISTDPETEVMVVRIPTDKNGNAVNTEVWPILEGSNFEFRRGATQKSDDGYMTPVYIGNMKTGDSHTAGSGGSISAVLEGLKRRGQGLGQPQGTPKQHEDGASQDIDNEIQPQQNKPGLLQDKQEFSRGSYTQEPTPEQKTKAMAELSALADKLGVGKKNWQALWEIERDGWTSFWEWLNAKTEQLGRMVIDSQKEAQKTLPGVMK